MNLHHRFPYPPVGRVGDRILLSTVVVLATALAAAPSGRAGDAPAPSAPSPVVVPAEAAPPLGLAECLALAHDKQPRIAVQRAALAAAEDGRRALDALGLAAALDAEIPVRRRQACLGVQAAQAALDQAEHDADYSVTHAYFTVLYAREQERVTADTVERLTATRDQAKTALDNGAKDVSNSDVQKASAYVHLAEVRRTQATQGVKRALAALGEAIGLGPDACPNVPAAPLPEPEARPNRDEVVALALARQGELIQAGILVEVTCLEVDAQGASMHQRMDTFAIGSDVHSGPVAPELPDPNYRPGAVPPEMPAQLVGPRPERMRHARSLNARAAAAADATRNLVALGAQDAFLRWEEAATAAEQARAAADAGDELAKGLDTDFKTHVISKVEDVTSARVLAAQAQSQYIDLRYQEILALADLERITAGGFCARLAEAHPTTAATPAPDAK